MKTASKFAMLLLAMCALTVCGFGVTPLNLVRGAVGPMNSNNSWSNYSVVTLIPGAALIPVTSTQTVFYLNFTAGSTADISNMVLYTTAHGGLTITAVTPVKLGGVSNPSIPLSSTSVCPTQPLSTSTPCTVRLDPTAIVLSAANDYYLAIKFANDGNNGSIGASQPTYSFSPLMSWFVASTDETQLTVGQSIPSMSFSNPFFLSYVMTN